MREQQQTRNTGEVVRGRKYIQLFNTGIHDVQSQKEKRVDKDFLVNTINYINFQGKTILVNFQDAASDLDVFHHARPLPCTGERLDCLWEYPGRHINNLKTLKFKNVLVTDGRMLLSVTSEVNNVSEKGISIDLSDACCRASYRRVKRYLCRDIQALLIHNNTHYYGTLIDFSAVAFCIEVEIAFPDTMNRIGTETSVDIILYDSEKLLFAGECRIIRKRCHVYKGFYVLEPTIDQAQRYKPRKFRSIRQVLVPSPDIVFTHPFIDRVFNLKVTDVSGMGLSVKEDEHSSILLPGMILPSVKIDFANSFQITCRAQVVYRKNLGDGTIKCGLAIIDITPANHIKLLAVLHQAENGKSYLCNQLDMDLLWRFFFEAGFIYPNKYQYIHTSKDAIKDTYDKLYLTDNSIARHFIYQDRGSILGHMSMLRFYGNTWLIHHHASKSAVLRAGLAVLHQIGRLVHDSYRLKSLHMDYFMCYYRPENKFPKLIFGGVAKRIKNYKICSLDTFAYFHNNTSSNSVNLPESWTLSKTQPEDLYILDKFYEQESGGLMIQALGLKPDKVEDGELLKEYRKLGFKKAKMLFSLRKREKLMAVIMLNISNIGLNMSELTNCIKIIILEPDDLPLDIFNTVLSVVSGLSEKEDIPVLLYPLSYAEKKHVSYEKLYNMWIMDPHYLDYYFKYVNRMLRFSRT